MNSSQHQHIYTLFILVPRNNRSLGIMRVLFCNDRGEAGDQRRLANGEGGLLDSSLLNEAFCCVVKGGKRKWWFEFFCRVFGLFLIFLFFFLFFSSWSDLNLFSDRHPTASPPPPFYFASTKPARQSLPLPLHRPLPTIGIISALCQLHPLFKSNVVCRWPKSESLL